MRTILALINTVLTKELLKLLEEVAAKTLTNLQKLKVLVEYLTQIIH
jgi:hypothetical protein